MKRRPALVLLLAIASSAGAGLACARGGSLTQNLLEKGHRALSEAERAHFAKDEGRARQQGAQAERLFEDAWAQDPTDTRTPMLGGQAAAFARDLKAATKWVNRLGRISRLREGDPDVHYLSAFVHLIGAERPDRAIKALKRMLSLNPRARPSERDHLWYLALSALGKSYMDAEKWNEAVDQFRSGAVLARRMADRRRELSMLGNVGMAMRRGDRYIEATELFESLVKAEPGDPLWHWHLGLTLALQSRMAEAIPVYREVVRLREAGRAAPAVREELGRVYLRLGNCLRNVAARERDDQRRRAMLEEALTLLTHYREQEQPQDPLAHKWAGVLLFEEFERPYEALPYFHRAFELDPECEDALAYIVKIHERYPPPPEQLPADDPAAAEAARKAWKAPIAGWKKNIVAGKERRQKIRDERVRKTGDSGCD